MSALASLAGGVRRTVAERQATLAGRAATWALAVVAFLLFVRIGFHPPKGEYFNGFANGCLYGLVGVGIVLIYRTNRIINFAAASLGAVPGILCALLVAKKGWSWYVVLPLCLLMGAALGGLVELVIIRRFRDKPRLILTVVTIGLTQVFAYVGFLIPGWLGEGGRPALMVTPMTHSWQFHIGNQRFSGDYPFTIVAAFVAAGLLAVFLRYSRMGIALRASSENADRAALLGIPVRRVQTVAWIIASTLAALVIFQRSAIIGVPSDGSLGPQVLLFAMAAAVIGRMENVPATLAAGIAIGMLAEASIVRTGADSLTGAIMLVVILAALLLQRRRMARAYDTGVSSWETVKEFRPIPLELRRLPEVLRFRAALGAVVAVVLIGAPFVLGRARVGYLQIMVIDAIVAVSLVILSGWGGQISLGQAGIVGVGAVTAGKLAAEHNADFFVALGAGILIGTLVAVLIGLPALRIQGLYLAVTTLAFGGAMEFYFLDHSYWIGRHILPREGTRIRLPVLWGRVALGSRGGVPGTGYYFLCLAFLGLAVLMARAYRRNRAGRAVMAVRENPRAAASYAVNPARTKLGAFAVSGAIASVAGVLQAYQSGHIDSASYGIFNSLTIFTITVIGGLTSLGGAIYGVVAIDGLNYFQTFFKHTLHVPRIKLLVAGPGLILTLMLSPGGFAQVGYDLRDRFLRRVANRRQIVVPSLFADRRIETGEGEQEVIAGAEHKVEVGAFDVLTEPSISCPVCGEVLTVDAAVGHEHLQVGTGVHT